MSNATLCAVCVNAIEKSLENLVGYQIHHSSLESFKQAYESGCPLCCMIQLKGIGPDVMGTDSSTMTENISFRSWLCEMGWRGILRIKMEFKITPCEESLDFSLHYAPRDQDTLKPIDYIPERSTSSESCLNLAQWWIKNCNQTHKKCRQIRTPPGARGLPTRLISVGEGDSSLRLVLGQDLLKDTRYATLSHCWGIIEDKLVLTKSNLEHWKRKIPHRDNLKTFYDAIDITRRLEIGYIWIDSLCIIQDSKEDWVVESSRMADVYAQSYLTIAATSSKDDTGGCYFDRNVERELPIHFYIDAKNKRLVGSVTDREAIGDQLKCPVSLAFDDYKDWEHQIKDSPLYTRAWVMQERLISQRVLHFANSQLYWECEDLTASEAFPYGVETLDSKQHGFSVYVSPGHLSPYSYGGWGCVLKKWGATVEMYSRCGLTKPEDKLVAISGIARRFQPYMSCRYLAGHWESHLIWQLPWRGYKYTPASKSTLQYHAPSWSWAYHNRPIDYCDVLSSRSRRVYEVYHELVDILDVVVEPLHSDPYGQVKSGSLRLLGSLFALEFSLEAEYHLNFEGMAASCNGEKSIFGTYFDVDGSQPCPLFCLPLLVSTEDSFGICVNFESIILHPTDQSGVFRRVGYLGNGVESGLDLGRDDFTKDPLLRSIGTVDWSKKPGKFTRNRSNEQEIIII